MLGEFQKGEKCAAYKNLAENPAISRDPGIFWDGELTTCDNGELNEVRFFTTISAPVA